MNVRFKVEHLELRLILQERLKTEERFVFLYGEKYLDYFLLQCSRANWIWADQLKKRGSVYGLITQPHAATTGGSIPGPQKRVELTYFNHMVSGPHLQAHEVSSSDEPSFPITSHFFIEIHDQNDPMRIMELATKFNFRFVFSEALGGRAVLFDIVRDPLPSILQPLSATEAIPFHADFRDTSWGIS